MTEVDLKSGVDPLRLAHRTNLVLSAKPALARVSMSPLKAIVTGVKSSRALEMLQHFMYQDPQSYLNLYLMYGDNADYLRPPFSSLWRQRLADTDLIVGEMADRAHSAGIPFALMAGVQASQVALVGQPRTGADPAAFGAALKKIADRHQVLFIDPLMPLAKVPHPIGLFYVVDGHIGPAGQQILASTVEQHLLSSGWKPFESCKARPEKASLPEERGSEE